MANISNRSTQTVRLQKPMYLDFLPEEILFKIFMDVPRCKFYFLAQVSPRFKRICGDWRFWGKVTVREETISYYEFEQLIAGPWVIRELDLTAVKIRSSEYNASLRRIVDKLNISRVHMDRTNWEGKSFLPEFLETAMVTACRPRFELKVDGGVRLSRDLANAIAKSTKLQVLSMELVRLNVYNSDISSLARMFESLRQLKELNMRLATLNIDQLMTMCGSMSTVEKLFLNHLWVQNKLKNSCYMGRPEKIVEWLSMLLRRSNKLNHLGMSWYHITHQAVIEELAQLRCLEYIHFCMCDFVSPRIDVLAQIASRLTTLRRVHFSQCPFRQDLTVENAQDDLENWSATIEGRYTTISFTDVECVIEFVSPHKRFRS